MTKNSKITLLILIVVLLGGYVVYYSLQSKSPLPPTSDQTELTQAQRDQIILNLQEVASKSPPLTDSQRIKIIENLNKINNK